MKQLAWAVMFLTAAVPGRADADCESPHWFGAADGSALPARGSIYVHHEILRYSEPGDPLPQPAIQWIGAASTVSVEKVSDVVVRIDYDAPHAFGAALKSDPEDYYDPTHVTFDPRWAAPAKAPRVVQYWHEFSKWACSSSDSVNIQLDQPVAAVRLRWTFHGETREWIEAPRSTELSVIELGKFNCGGTTVEPEELAAGGHLEMIAIRTDRSEVAVTGLPAILSSKEMPSGDSDRALHVQSLAAVVDEISEVEEPQRVNKAPEPKPTPGVGLGVVVLGVVALGGLLALRYRVRAPSSLPPTS